VGGGEQGMRLDSLEEGGRRLVACSPASSPPQKGKERFSSCEGLLWQCKAVLIGPEVGRDYSNSPPTGQLERNDS